MKEIRFKKYEDLIQEGSFSVLDIQFSGSTYQLEIVDKESNQVVFPFLQFDQNGHLKDCFCTCEKAEENNECIHLALALKKIYRGHPQPLHVRFEHSFWNILGKECADELGYEIHKIKKIHEGVYQVESSPFLPAFHIQAEEIEIKKKLYRLIEARAKETEETSLKFSNLSQEEISHWKEGRPSPQLSYELSFWSDLAKYLILLQEEGFPYTMVFEDNPQGYPEEVRIDWGFLKLNVRLTQQQLLKLIPSLDSVHSSLKVFKPHMEEIEAITYDQKEQAFTIKKKLIPDPNFLYREKEELKRLGNWLYLPAQGFYPLQTSSPFASGYIAKNEIAAFLDQHYLTIKQYVENCTIHEGQFTLSYRLFFDASWNLHSISYLFTEDDFKKPHSHFFDNWAYIEDLGFFHLLENLFNASEKIIPQEEMSAFINLHRIWLNTQPGFHTHISTLDTQFTYKVTPEESLKFISRTSYLEDNQESKDFGEWVYFKNEGFYSKLSGRNGLSVKPGVEVRAEDISTFIKNHRDELEHLPDFFLKECPLIEVGLKIQLKFQSQIVINPHYQLLSTYQGIPYRLFGDFIYLEGRGFYELPFSLRLPDKYRSVVVIHQDLLLFFVRHELEGLKKWIINSDRRLIQPDFYILEMDKIEKKSEGGLLARVYYRTDIGVVYATQIQSALQRGKRYLFSEAGLIDLQNESFHWLKKLPRRKTKEITDQMLQLSLIDFLRLEALHGLKYAESLYDTQEPSLNFLKELKDFKVSEPPSLMGLKCDLRLYQKTGICWLWFLYQNGLSGLLCDDMGLGKTHQAMALMAAIKQQFPEKSVRFLVICPTSVIYHWQEKLSRFLPDLKVLVFHGVKRSLEGVKDYDLLLTSYGIMRSEKERLKTFPFEVAIFDEIQIAKNANSRVHEALLKVDAKMKLGLTGTPIENHLRELKSLFDLILKGYMPNDAQFKEFFINPIEKDASDERKKLLAKLIKPFILRRKKIEVLQELPEKTEENAYCELVPQQQKLYAEVLEREKQQLVRQLKDRNNPIPYIHVFALLATLKQICDHPALFYKDPVNYKNYHSGKWQLFVELLNEAKESGQKIVIFTQYLYMLDIIELYLKEKEWSYAQIRGETIHRSEELKKFQEDPQCCIFIGTLQAAGLGIDLTAASVVIHYDRWWNAARENQATDRVHRIGQKRGVQVFKLITVDTIEEKIDRLIERKGRLMEELILSDDEQQIKRFTRDELIDLLSL